MSASPIAVPPRVRSPRLVLHRWWSATVGRTVAPSPGRQPWRRFISPGLFIREFVGWSSRRGSVIPATDKGVGFGSSGSGRSRAAIRRRCAPRPRAAPRSSPPARGRLALGQPALLADVRAVRPPSHGWASSAPRPQPAPAGALRTRLPDRTPIARGCRYHRHAWGSTGSSRGRTGHSRRDDAGELPSREEPRAAGHRVLRLVVVHAGVPTGVRRRRRGRRRAGRLRLIVDTASHDDLTSLSLATPAHRWLPR